MDLLVEHRPPQLPDNGSPVSSEADKKGTHRMHHVNSNIRKLYSLYLLSQRGKKGKDDLPDEYLEPSLFDNEVIETGGIREYLRKWRAEQEVLALDPIQGPGTLGPSAGSKAWLPSMTSDERGGNAEEDVLEIEELAGSGEEQEQAYFLRPGDMVKMKP